MQRSSLPSADAALACSNRTFPLFEQQCNATAGQSAACAWFCGEHRVWGPAPGRAASKDRWQEVREDAETCTARAPARRGRGLRVGLVAPSFLGVSRCKGPASLAGWGHGGHLRIGNKPAPTWPHRESWQSRDGGGASTVQGPAAAALGAQAAMSRTDASARRPWALRSELEARTRVGGTGPRASGGSS
jgi:hypothetical protein